MNWERVDKYFTRIDKDWYASLTERESLLCSNNTHRQTKWFGEKKRYLCFRGERNERK